ncbi:Arp2/3 complex, 34 kd subunit p34-Arc-domain-containing protein [Gorgonomyces haynaldii]|nr:Arp2/3 complex, 34 kd subunit p34-Arc-domain-containing protein [Gorgonomyces haynaldii]
MILLEPGSKILEECLKERIYGEPEKCLIVLADFDGVRYKISTPISKTQLLISIQIKCYPELVAYGAQSVLERIYGGLLQPQPEQGFDVSLVVDLERLPEDKESLIKNLALLKRNVMAAPFEVAFATQQQGKESSMMAVHYRDNEAIYIRAMADRVTVIFSTQFKDETDKIYGKVFLQEFVDARRQPSIQNAPQVLYTNREPPLELRNYPGLRDSDDIGYVTFVLFPRHFQGNNAFDCISRIQLFRDYFHFHIKASKAYMHSRMRARVDSFLKILNRAKPEKPDPKKVSNVIAARR